jgi:hypothetical protein
MQTSDFHKSLIYKFSLDQNDHHSLGLSDKDSGLAAAVGSLFIFEGW